MPDPLQEFIDKKFKCECCGACCRAKGFVYLQETDIQTAAAFLNISKEEFVNRCCELQNRRRLVLKKHLDESCVFLKESRCLIYPARPIQCRDFPYRWRTPASLEYCAGMAPFDPKSFE